MIVLVKDLWHIKRMLKIPTLTEGVGIKGINTNIVYHFAGFIKHAWLP